MAKLLDGLKTRTSRLGPLATMGRYTDSMITKTRRHANRNNQCCRRNLTPKKMTIKMQILRRISKSIVSIGIIDTTLFLKPLIMLYQNMIKAIIDKIDRGS